MRFVALLGWSATLAACAAESPGASGGAAQKEPAIVEEASVEEASAPLDTKAMASLMEALESVRPTAQVKMASAGLVEVEGDRLPSFLSAALEAYASAAPDQKARSIAMAIDSWSGRAAWGRACSGGLEVLSELAMVAPEARGPLLWEKCELGRFPSLSAEKVKLADPTATLLVVLFLDHLTRRGSLSEDETSVIGRLLEVPDPAGVEGGGPADEGESPGSATAELAKDVTWALTATPRTVSMGQRDAVELTIEVTNVGSETVDPKQHLGRFELDGVAHMGLELWFGNGLRTMTWSALPPGETATDVRKVGEQLFEAPGEYVVGFRYGESVATATVLVTK